MDDKKLNTLAAKVKSGEKDAKWQLIHHFTGLIYKLSDKNSRKLKQESFENDCFNSIIRAARHFNPERASFRTLATRSIYRTLSKHKERYKQYLNGSTVCSLHGLIESEEDLPIADETVDVEKSLITKMLVQEGIALLAEGDPRRVAAIEAWMEGYKNTTELAARLSQYFGGSTASNRKFITRFKAECQKALVDAI